MTGPIIVSPRAAEYALDCGFTRGKCVFLGIMGMIFYKTVVLVRFGLVAHTIRYMDDASSQTLVNCIVSDSATCFQMQVLEKIPKGLLLVTSRSVVFLCSRLLLYESSFSTGIAHTKFETAPVNTELTHRMNNSEQEICVEASALKCMVSFTFSVLRIPRLNALALVKNG